jgi:hypothetical protein
VITRDACDSRAKFRVYDEHELLEIPVQQLARFAAAIVGIALLAAACDSDSSGPNETLADLTVVHASAGVGAIDVTVDGETAVSNLAFGSASPRIQVPSGVQRIVVRAGDDVIGEIDATLTTSHVNAVVVASGEVRVAGTVVPDTGQVATTRANLRLVNVVGANATAPTSLDILINMPGVSPDSTARLGGLDTRIASYSSLLYFDPGAFRLRYVPQGTTTVLAEAEFDIAMGETKVAVLERDADGSYRVTIVVESSG